MVKKIISTVINVVSILLILFAVLILVIVVFTKKGQAPNVMGYSAFRVLTQSMEPTIPTDTMVVVKRVGPEEIQTGDVITFYSADPQILGQVNTHRVYAIESDDSGLYYVTKGDNNPIPDEAIVRPENVIGKVIGQSGIMGKITRLSANPIIYVLFIFIPLLVFLISNLVQTVKTVKEIEVEEAQEDIRRLEEALAQREAERNKENEPLKASEVPGDKPEDTEK